MLGRVSKLPLLSKITLLPFGRDVTLRNVRSGFASGGEEKHKAMRQQRQGTNERSLTYLLIGFSQDSVGGISTWVRGYFVNDFRSYATYDWFLQNCLNVASLRDARSEDILSPHKQYTMLLPLVATPYIVCTVLLKFSLFEAVNNQSYIKLEP